MSAVCDPERPLNLDAFTELCYEIRAIQELLGRKDVNTTMVYTHVPKKAGRSVRSPVDDL